MNKINDRSKPNVRIKHATGKPVLLENNYHVTRNGEMYLLANNHVWVKIECYDGYIRSNKVTKAVTLDGKYRVNVKELVIEAYYDGFCKGMFIDNINGNWQDCNLNNLRVYRNRYRRELVNLTPRKDGLLQPNNIDLSTMNIGDLRNYIESMSVMLEAKEKAKTDKLAQMERERIEHEKRMAELQAEIDNM